jgi:hypothetical protein
MLRLSIDKKQYSALTVTTSLSKEFNFFVVDLSLMLDAGVYPENLCFPAVQN